MKARPSPVSVTTFTEGSRSAWVIAASSASAIGKSSALSRSGRFIRTAAIPPAISRRTSGSVMASSLGAMGHCHFNLVLRPVSGKNESNSIWEAVMEEVRRERRGAALWLTIDREPRRNALNEEVLKALRAGVESAKIEDGI